MLLFFGINLFLQLFVTKNIIFCFTLLLFQITIQILAQYKEAGGDGTRGLEQSSLVKGCPPVRWLTIYEGVEPCSPGREPHPTPFAKAQQHQAQRTTICTHTHYTGTYVGLPYAHIHITQAHMQDYTLLYILLPSFSLLHKYINLKESPLSTYNILLCVKISTCPKMVHCQCSSTSFSTQAFIYLSLLCVIYFIIYYLLNIL